MVTGKDVGQKVAMNSHIQQRGLPPTPGPGYHDNMRPPPSPREMYSMYASIDEPGHNKQAPPPPKRNPETRLSTFSSQVGVFYILFIYNTEYVIK